MSLHQHESTTTQSITWHDTLIEAHRLVNKAQLLIQVLGGLLPGLSSEHLQQITSVLEIACGPGLWAQEMARAHPQAQVIGVDTSPVMIAFARSTLSHHNLANINYIELASFTGSYPFKEATFDLVSVQFMSKFLTANAWPHFLSTCWRLLRPGGLIRLTEYEVGLANAPAYEELSQLFLRAMRLAGRSISPSDRHLGILCELEALLCAAGFRERSSVAHLVNCSYGTP
ncbi:MAG TPA: class I SAM-dependent methyltransferase, partial [Ktedonobacteraceae bacterium]